MNNPIKSLFTIATETISGIRALPAIHTLAQESTDAAISERAAAHVDVRAKDLERKLAEQTREIEKLRAAKSRLEGGFETVHQLFLRSSLDSFREIRDHDDALSVERFIGDERWAWAKERLAENEGYQDELNNLVRCIFEAKDALARTVTEQTKEIEGLRAARAIAENALERSRADVARHEERIVALTNEANDLARAVESTRLECQRKLDLQWDAVKAMEGERDGLRGIVERVTAERDYAEHELEMHIQT